ncbi:flagellar hook-length control protein FliK [Sphingomonas cannabina]|uniref:flagellar hook-length control protein FliK n=1 Tax=Sphingomonas cannabina TaxID=2899123 RepID=UPI001F2B88BB|nr:flagellar hook-length control protein FliK [Sphingomonas cannabina]UIJ45433.1 flagellar hook-length control protein FliK [Sphingomonas cannabina]
MIQITTLLATGPIDAPRPAGSIPPISADFAVALEQMLAPAASPLAPGAAADMPAIGRQMPAAGGKDLPAVEIADLPALDIPTATGTPPAPPVARPRTDIDVAALAAVAAGEALTDPEASGAKARETAEAPATPAILPTPSGAKKIKSERHARTDAEPVSGKKVRMAEVPAQPSAEMVAERPEAGSKVEAEPEPHDRKAKKAKDVAVAIASPTVPIPEPVVIHAAPEIRSGRSAPPNLDIAQSSPLATTGRAASEPTTAAAPDAPVGPETKIELPATPRQPAESVPEPTAQPQPALVAAMPLRPSRPLESESAPVIRLPLAAPERPKPGAAPVVLRPATAAPKPQPIGTASPAAQPAAQAFAAAIFAAERAAPAKREDAAADPAAILPGVSAPAGQAPVAVHASAQAHGAPLDTRRDDWMGQMIERIEMIRDEGGAREAHIRLAPDALGKVDVAIRHDGDTVHVQLTADTPAARTLLADAAPRLAEMAESRGLKLGGSGVDSGNPQAQPDARDPRQPAAPFRPRSPAAAARDLPETSDERVA